MSTLEPLVPAVIIVDNILPFLDRETYDNSVVANKEIWNLSQAASIPPWPQTCFSVEGTAGVSCVAFSACGKAVACGCDNGAVSLWGISGRKVTLKSHPSSISSLVFSPTGSLLVAGCENGFVRTWKLEWRHPNLLVPMGNDGSVLKVGESCIHSLAFIPNTNILISSARETSACIWNLSTLRLITRIQHPERIESLTISPRGDLFASATWEGTVRLFKLDHDHKLSHMAVLGKGLPLSKVEFADDGNSLFALRGFRLRQWDMTNGSPSFLSGNRVHRVFSVTVSPDASVVAYGDRDGTIRTSVLANSISRASFKDTFYGHHHQCCLAFAPNGTALASGSADGTLRIWNV